jgi:hypothetical protein
VISRTFLSASGANDHTFNPSIVSGRDHFKIQKSFAAFCVVYLSYFVMPARPSSIRPRKILRGKGKRISAVDPALHHPDVGQLHALCHGVRLSAFQWNQMDPARQ